MRMRPWALLATMAGALLAWGLSCMRLGCRSTNIWIDLDLPCLVCLCAFRAPEQKAVVRGRPWYAPRNLELSTKCDVWAFGCMLLEMLTGKGPWHGLTEVQSIGAHMETRSPPIPEGVTGPMRELLTRCFALEPQARPTAVELRDTVLQLSTSQLQLGPDDASPASGASALATPTAGPLLGGAALKVWWHKPCKHPGRVVAGSWYHTVRYGPYHVAEQVSK